MFYRIKRLETVSNQIRSVGILRQLHETGRGLRLDGTDRAFCALVENSGHFEQRPIAIFAGVAMEGVKRRAVE